MPRVLLEDCQGTFVVDRTNIVKESLASGTQVSRIPGRLSVCDTVNGNNRRYRKSVWEANLKEGSTLRKLVELNSAFGTLEHPADGKIDLSSPLSHLLVKVGWGDLKESSSGKDEIWGEILVLDTQEGRKLNALIEAGYNPTVSSRGFGSLVKGNDGVDEVQDDFICEGWDVVLKPSFVQAVMTPARIESTPKVESIKDETPSPSPISEAKPAVSAAGTSLPESKAEVKPSAPTATSKTMNIGQIKESIAQMRDYDPKALAPARFAEGLNRMGALHNEIAKYQAEDASRSWEASQLHDELKVVESTWHDAAAAPAKAAKKLEESNTKLLQVIKAVTTTGISYKTKLSESASKLDKSTQLAEELAKRGRGWKAKFESAENEMQSLEKRYTTACEALDKLAAKYKTDITALGRRVLEMEFPEKVKEAKIAEALKNAKVPKDIVAIREEIEGKPAEEVPATEVPSEEKKEDAKEEAPKAPEVPASKVKESVKPAPVTENVSIVNKHTRDPRNVNESVEMTLRLSRGAQAAA